MKFKRSISFILMTSLCCMLTLGGCAESAPAASPSAVPTGSQVGETQKTVSAIEVETRPEKTEFTVGDEFTFEGGTLLVTYSDGTSEVLPMSADGVEITEPGLSATGTKQVRIKYGDVSCRYTVKVVSQSFKVIFDQNYEGAPAAEEQTVLMGDTAQDPGITRDGYTLYGWYTSKDYIETFDFSTPVSGDITLYALWLQDGGDYCNVSVNYDYYGGKITEYSYPVLTGEKISKPSEDPVRTGYQFVKWVDQNGTDFDFDSPVTADTTVKAVWEKTVSGMNDYIFEAEDTDLTGKVGPSLSGQAVGTGMIVKLEDRNASGDRYVSYLYQKGLTVDFYFASDADVSDATIYVSLSAEYRDYTYNPDNYRILLNGEELDYDDLVFVNTPEANDNLVDCLPFQFYLVGSGLKLKEGANSLILETYNEDPNPGTTMLAAAPIVDAIKINTSAVLTWDGSKDLPCVNY